MPAVEMAVVEEAAVVAVVVVLEMEDLLLIGKVVVDVVEVDVVV